MKNIIKAHNICYPGCITNISFTVSEGEILAIDTDSEYASSAILSIICGLIKPDSGTITINGKKPEVSFLNYGYFFTSGSNEINYLMLNNMLETYGIISHKTENIYKPGYGIFIQSLLSLTEIILINEPVSAYFCRNEGLMQFLGKIVSDENKICIMAAKDINKITEIHQKISRILLL